MKGFEDFLSQNRFFSLETVKKCMKKRPHRHTRKRDQQTNVFPQHHKNYATSIIMFASSFNAVRSSPSIISKNVSSKSSRSSNRSSTVKVRAMGMKKGSLLFSFSSSRRNPSHLISSFSKMDVFLSLFLFR
jgi:hypothetical protein